MSDARIDEMYQAFCSLNLLLTGNQIEALITAIIDGKIPYVVTVDDFGPLGQRSYTPIASELTQGGSHVP